MAHSFRRNGIWYIRYKDETGRWKTKSCSKDANKTDADYPARNPFRTMAERQGFEPWARETPRNGFRDRPFQPLRHLSTLFIINDLQ